MKHLEGITVLNEYMTYIPAEWTTIVFASSILFAIIALFFTIFDYPDVTIAFLIITLVVFLGGIICMCAFTIEDGMVYECFVDDSITFKELINTYEIIEQRGDIYKLKFLNN